MTTAATWDDLKSSIVSILDFNLFGVPMIGADICGFGRDTTEELCARWIEVGAFYPFARDHNAIGSAPQELYLWESVAEASRSALAMRYQLLPFLYTLFHEAHTTGSPVVRSLWLNFPEDAATLSIDGQFMWGAAVLVSPVLQAGASSVSAYFPAGLWYDFASRQVAVDSTSASGGASGGVWKTLSAPLTKVNVHVRGGSVLALQDAAMTTAASRRSAFTLVVALCPGGRAYGELFWDDGGESVVAEEERYLAMAYRAETMTGTGTGTAPGAAATATGSLRATVTHDAYPAAAALTLREVVVMGSAAQLGSAVLAPSGVTVNGEALSADQIVFDGQAARLTFTGLRLSIASAFVIEWK